MWNHKNKTQGDELSLLLPPAFNQDSPSRHESFSTPNYPIPPQVFRPMHELSPIGPRASRQELLFPSKNSLQHLQQNSRASLFRTTTSNTWPVCCFSHPILKSRNSDTIYKKTSQAPSRLQLPLQTVASAPSAHHARHPYPIDSTAYLDRPATQHLMCPWSIPLKADRNHKTQKGVRQYCRQHIY